MVVFIWIALSVVVGIAGSARGRSGFGWFLIALIFSPLIGLIAVLVLPNLKIEQKAKADFDQLLKTHVKCPDCAELVKAEASVCKHCGCKLIPQKVDLKPASYNVAKELGKRFSAKK
jgi:hypothetical protein